MTHQQIQSLLVPPSSHQANEKTRAYLNEKFPKLKDLRSLDAILIAVKRDNDDLQSKFSTSQIELDRLLKQTKGRTEQHLVTAQELSLFRHSLEDELLGLVEELISSTSDEGRKPTLLEDIETLHRNLKELESVKGYLQVVEYGLKLSEAAVQQVRGATSLSTAALSVFQALQGFVSQVDSACAAEVEDASGKQGLHIVNFLKKLVEKTWSDIKLAHSGALLSASEKLGWPMSVDFAAASPTDRNAFEKAFLDLLRLQSLGEKIGISESIKEKPGLYAMQTLVQPVSLRFKFHFEGKRQTNRLDKPEWYLTHILNVVHDQKPFMDTIIQLFLSSTEYSYISAWREFIFLLFPLAIRKLKTTIPQILSHPPLLAHTIYQTITFDVAISEEGFLLQGTSGAKRIGGKYQDEESWKGVSEVILGNRAWFEAWVAGEQRFTEDQYLQTISSGDAWAIADDSGGGDVSHSPTKVTNSARRVKALIEQVTDRYSLLPKFDQRIRFLTSVQFPILDQYHARIATSLDAFETLSSAFVRAVPGALTESNRTETRKSLTSGVEGVQRLCKAMLSAKFIGDVMIGWGEDLFFLELWTEINNTASLRTLLESNSLVPKPSALDGGVPQNTLFDKLIGYYQNLVQRSEDMIVQHVVGEVQATFKAHLNLTANKAIEIDDFTISQTLLVPIALLSSYLTYFVSIFTIPTLTVLYRRIASDIAEHLLQRQILYRGQITASDGITILAECGLWVETCVTILSSVIPGGRNRIEAPWYRFMQAAKLLSLVDSLDDIGNGMEGPWSKVVNATFGIKRDDEWEELLIEHVGLCEISREEVAQVLRCREDCDR